MRHKISNTKNIILEFDGFFIDTKFKKGVKNLRLKVLKNTKITLTLPFYTTQKVAFEFLNRHKDWLRETQTKIINNMPKDDEVRLLGKIYKIKIEQNKDKVSIFQDEIITANLKAFEKFKRQKAKEVFINFIDKLEPIVGKKVNKLTIRQMNTRWGSCNTKKGYINLNLNLIEKPLNLIEYVVLHELTHLIYPHHKREFYDFIKEIMPDFRQREMALNQVI